MVGDHDHLSLEDRRLEHHRRQRADHELGVLEQRRVVLERGHRRPAALEGVRVERAQVLVPHLRIDHHVREARLVHAVRHPPLASLRMRPVDDLEVEPLPFDLPIEQLERGPLVERHVAAGEQDVAERERRLCRVRLAVEVPVYVGRPQNRDAFLRDPVDALCVVDALRPHDAEVVRQDRIGALARQVVPVERDQQRRDPELTRAAEGIQDERVRPARRRDDDVRAKLADRLVELGQDAQLPHVAPRDQVPQPGQGLQLQHALARRAA